MEETSSSILPKIEIIFEDEDMLVVNKPARMTVNRAETTRDEVTVQDWMEDRYSSIKEKVVSSKGKTEERVKRNEGEDGEVRPAFAEGYGEARWDPVVEFYNRGGVVHRLDKETSGVLLLAKHPEAFAELQRQFKERTVEKTYLALAHGKVVPKEGEVSVPVGRLPWNRKQFGIVPGGRESVTNYNVLEYYKSRGKELFSLLELYPHTGRTHQIRVHMKYIGHPLFADFLYAGRKTSRNDRRVLDRVFLHAGKIAFVHPKSGEKLTFEAPFPDELQGVLEKMEKLSE